MVLRKLVSRDTLINEHSDKSLLKVLLNKGLSIFNYDVNAELSEEKDAFFISYNHERACNILLYV